MQQGDSPRPSGTEGPTPVEPTPAAAVTRRTALRSGLAVLASAPVVLPATVSAQVASNPGRLVLKHNDLAPKIQAYFKKISGDKAAQKAFVDNPTKVMADEFLPGEFKKLSPQRISNANRFLYAALANEKFNKWAQEYQQQLAKKKTINKAEVLKDFSKALVEQGSPELTLAILDGLELNKVTPLETDQAGLVVDVLIGVESIAIVAVAILAIPVVVFGVTKEKPNALPTADLRGISEMLIARAESLKKGGKLLEVYSKH